MPYIIVRHVLIISLYTTKCKCFVNKNKLGGYLTKVRIRARLTPMPPKFSKGEVGPYTLCVAHSIPIFDVWPPSLLFLPTPGGYIFSWCFYGFLQFATKAAISNSIKQNTPLPPLNLSNIYHAFFNAKHPPSLLFWVPICTPYIFLLHFARSFYSEVP